MSTMETQKTNMTKVYDDVVSQFNCTATKLYDWKLNWWNCLAKGRRFIANYCGFFWAFGWIWMAHLSLTFIFISYLYTVWCFSLSGTFLFESNLNRNLLITRNYNLKKYSSKFPFVFQKNSRRASVSFHNKINIYSIRFDVSVSVRSG